MTTKIGLISDVHASPVPLKQALDIFKKEQVSEIFCAGDIAGYFDTLSATIALLKKYKCKSISGNHDQSWLQEHKDAENTEDYKFLQALPEMREFTIEHKTIFMVHAHPPASQHGGIKLLDQSGNIIPQQQDYWNEALKHFNYDVLIIGHTHQVYAETLGHTLVINPGSAQFNHSCMILSLPDLTLQIFALEDTDIIKSWNFSMLYGTSSRYPNAGT